MTKMHHLSCMAKPYMGESDESIMLNCPMCKSGIRKVPKPHFQPNSFSQKAQQNLKLAPKKTYYCSLKKIKWWCSTNQEMSSHKMNRTQQRQKVYSQSSQLDSSKHAPTERCNAAQALMAHSMHCHSQ